MPSHRHSELCYDSFLMRPRGPLQRLMPALGWVAATGAHLGEPNSTRFALALIDTRPHWSQCLRGCHAAPRDLSSGTPVAAKERVMYHGPALAR